MEDLKTLEDLEKGDGKDIVRTIVGNSLAVSVPNVSSYDLRQEAKKYIKNCSNTTRRHGEVMNCGQRLRCSACRRFKKFFNIEEGDLDE